MQHAVGLCSLAARVSHHQGLDRIAHGQAAIEQVDHGLGDRHFHIQEAGPGQYRA